VAGRSGAPHSRNWRGARIASFCAHGAYRTTFAVHFSGNDDQVYDHRASIVVPAPVDAVYDLFTHLHRYPEFLRHVASVRYYDDQNCRWAVDLERRCEWDAINDAWSRNVRIGWQAARGPKNRGEVLFRSLGAGATHVFVRLQYDMAAGRPLEAELQEDLQRLAARIERAKRDGALSWNALRQHAERGMAERGTLEPRPVGSQRILR
jgi:uncharacterized membrane protein